MACDAYFTEFTYAKGIFYSAVVIYLVTCCLVVSVEPWILPDYCYEVIESSIEFPNPLYRNTHCRNLRLPALLYMTPIECSFGRRLVISVLLGGIIGWERREADRPAGIRTMSLVSLGSCLFTINSAFAFLDGPMGWDASRISAAIPSGVGFLGAGLIFKEAEKDEHGAVSHVVHGLTTSASLWLSAAVGVACGGELYFAATFGIALMLVLLRFGPRFEQHDEDYEEEQEPPVNDTDMLRAQSYASIEIPQGMLAEESSHHDTEASSLVKRDTAKKSSIRRRAHLGGIV